MNVDMPILAQMDVMVVGGVQLVYPLQASSHWEDGPLDCLDKDEGGCSFGSPCFAWVLYCPSQVGTPNGSCLINLLE